MQVLTHPPRIADFDPTKRIRSSDYKLERTRLQLDLIHIQSHLRDEAECGIAIVFEGLDASGKGGAIARLTGHLDARGYRVYSTGAPTELEAKQHYLQRFHAMMPARGDMVNLRPLLARPRPRRTRRGLRRARGARARLPRDQ